MRIAYDRWGLFKVRTEKAKLNLNPEYQREEVWSRARQQLLVDSVIRGIDIPKFYLRMVDDPPFQYEVVDGQQRLRSIWQFFENTISLPPDGELVDGQAVAGKKYDELSPEMRDRFQGYNVDLVLIMDATRREVSDMFYRLQLSTPLRPAEKLNAMFSEMRNFVAEISEKPFFASTTVRNTRYAYHQLAAQCVGLELPNVRDVDFEGLRRMYLDYAEFDGSQPGAVKVQRVLDLLGRAFPKSSQALSSRAMVISVYRLASLLETKGILQDSTEDFAQFVTQFSKALREEVIKGVDASDTALLTFSRYSIQAGDRRKSIVERHDILLQRYTAAFPQHASVLEQDSDGVGE